MRTHIHHIIPRYQGGTDDPHNLIELTVEQHAEAHRLLFEQNNNWEDFVAWKTLCGQMTQSEASLRASAEGAKKGAKVRGLQLSKDREFQSRVGKLGGLALTFEQRSAAGKIGGSRSKGKPKTYDTPFVTNNPASIKVSCIRCRKIIGGSANLKQHFGGNRCAS